MEIILFGIYRTPYLHTIFDSKRLILKEKKLLEGEQLEKNEGLMEPAFAESFDGRCCSPNGMIIEPLQKLLRVLSIIKVA